MENGPRFHQVRGGGGVSSAFFRAFRGATYNWIQLSPLSAHMPSEIGAVHPSVRLGLRAQFHDARVTGALFVARSRIHDPRRTHTYARLTFASSKVVYVVGDACTCHACDGATEECRCHIVRKPFPLSADPLLRPGSFCKLLKF